MSEPHQLQRVRFGALSPEGYETESFFRENFNVERWRSAGRSCYWAADRSTPGVRYAADAVQLATGQQLCADAFFNSFYAGHWRALTSVRSLGLRLKFTGRVEICVNGHPALAREEILLKEEAGSDSETEWERILPEEALGGRFLRLSFTVKALDPAALRGGAWVTPDAPQRRMALGVIATTYNRPHFARRTVQGLLADPEVAAVIDRLLVVEQSDRPELGDLESAKCHRIVQPNYGCAGGFARGLYEACLARSAEDLTHVLIADDDIMIEPDSVFRAARLLAYATREIVLGGAMLDLFKPNRIVALGESLVRTDAGFFGIEQVYPNADVARISTLDFASLPRPEGYCAWWFCAFPCALVDKIGLPWAGFIRWDDINFGVRAGAAGFESYGMPGVGVWHVPFYSKSAPWTLYFDRYNELIQNALMGTSEVALYFDKVVREALDLLEQGQPEMAAALALVAEHYMGGWTHYQNRVFPAFLGGIRTLIKAHELVSGDLTHLAIIRAAVAQRLDVAAMRHSLAGIAVREELVRMVPTTYTAESWEKFFASGTLAYAAQASAA